MSVLVNAEEDAEEDAEDKDNNATDHRIESNYVNVKDEENDHSSEIHRENFAVKNHTNDANFMVKNHTNGANERDILSMTYFIFMFFTGMYHVARFQNFIKPKLPKKTIWTKSFQLS